MTRRALPSENDARLLEAIRTSRPDAVITALERGADANTTDTRGQRPLALARHSLTLMRTLLAHGADPNGRNLGDPRAPTVLMLLAESLGDDPFDRMRLIVKSGGDIDFRDADGETALFYAERALRPDVVGHLLALGANPNLRNRGGANVLMYALRAIEDDALRPAPLRIATVEREIVELIRRYGADESGRVDLELERACRAGDVDRVRGLLAEDANPSFCPAASVLALAAESGHVGVVEALVRAGADREHTLEGHTPIERAAMHGHVDVVRVLAEAGPLHSIASPLALARAYRHREVVAYLEDPHGWIARRDRLGACRPASELALFDAVRDASVEGIARALAAGANLSAERNGKTALEHAFELRAPDAVSLELIAAGAEVRPVINQIVWASAHAPSEAVRKFVEAGADVDLPTRMGRPLQVAARRGDLEVVRVLVEAGADLDAEARGQNPLSEAVLHGHDAVAVFLLEAGARIEVARTLAPLLALAAFGGRSTLAKALLDVGDDVNGPATIERECRTGAVDGPLLRLVAGGGAFGVARNVASFASATPLIIAAARGHLELVVLFAARGANLDATDDEGRTALVHARREGRLDVAEELLALGASPEPNLTPTHQLFLAIHRKDRLAARTALKCGAELEAGDTSAAQRGRTPLLVAIARGDEVMVGALLRHGARTDAAERAESPSAKPFDDDHGSRGRRALALAAREGHERIVARLLRAKADVDARDADGNTALGIAARNGHSRIVRRLVRAGAEVEARGERGRTALALAAESGQLDAVATLLALGATPDAPDARGRTPLALALAAGGSERLLRLLLAAGADVHARDARGRSVLELAAREGPRTETMLARCLERENQRRGGSLGALTRSRLLPMCSVTADDRRFGRSHVSEEAIDVTLYDSERVRRALVARFADGALEAIRPRLETLTGGSARRIDGFGGYELHVHSSRALDLAELQPRLLESGVFVFAARMRPRSGLPDRIMVLPTRDHLEAVAAVGTRGSSPDFSNEEILSCLAGLQRRHGYRLHEIAADRLSGVFLEAPPDPEALAETLAEIAPDLIEREGFDLDGLSELVSARLFRLAWS